jgi:AcrR family transcriptional regulator
MIGIAPDERKMPRPRTVSDADLLLAAATEAAQAGPARLTLARVARRAGLAPATLVQRFGSKLGLLRAMARWWVGGIVAEQAAMRAAHASPLAALREYLACFAGLARTPKDLAHHLGFIQMDLTDPVLHRLMRDGMRRTEQGIGAMIEDAEAAGELRGADAAALARTLNALLTGALVQWAVQREGTARAWLEREIDVVLGPYLPAARPEPAARGTRSRRATSAPR